MIQPLPGDEDSRPGNGPLTRPGSIGRGVDQPTPGAPDNQYRPSRSIPASSVILRSWALLLLGSEEGPSASLWSVAAGAPQAAWDLFLRIERCALALQNRLDQTSGWSRLPGPVVKLIRGHASGELMRALSARAQIRTVGGLATEHGWNVMVLKGGVAVGSGELLHLGDLDILVDPGVIGEVERALAGLGFEAQGDATSYHLAPQAMANSIEIEVHRSLADGTTLGELSLAAVPLPGEPSLLRPGGRDHLLFLLHHSTEDHAERTGRIRELLLLSHALRTASPAEVEEVAAELDQAEERERMAAVLRAARTFTDRSLDRDPFAGAALRVHTLFHHFLRLSESRFGLQILARSAELVSRGWSAWRPVYTEISSGPMRTISRRPLLAWLDRHARPLASAARWILGLLSFGAVVSITAIVRSIAFLTAPRARR